MKKNVMKTIATGMSIALVAGILAGCGAKQPEAPKAETKTETQAASAEAGDDVVYNIGICQLVQHDALDQATKGFTDALNELIGEEHLNIDYQVAQGDSAVCATIANQFVSSGYDLIMANATPSLQACAIATNEIPIVATAITNFPTALDIELDENGASGMNVTGTNDLTPMKDQAEMIKEIFPDVQHVGIIYCSAEVNSIYQAEHMAEYLDELNIAHTDYTFADSNDLQAIVQTACDNCDVLYAPTDNVVSSNQGIIDAVARPAGVPIICGEEGQCVTCGLASLSLSFYQIGHRAGEMAYEILVNGADPATMPIEDPAELTKVCNSEIAAALGITLGDEYKPVNE